MLTQFGLFRCSPFDADFPYRNWTATHQGTLLVTSTNVSVSGDDVTAEPTPDGQATYVSGPYGTLVELTNNSGGGWESFHENYNSFSPTIRVRLGYGNDTLIPQYPFGTASRLLLSGVSQGGGAVFAASRMGDDDCPYFGQAFGFRSNCNDPNPHVQYATFTAEPTPAGRCSRY